MLITEVLRSDLVNKYSQLLYQERIMTGIDRLVTDE